MGQNLALRLLFAAVPVVAILLLVFRRTGNRVAVAPSAGASAFAIAALDARFGWLGNVRLRHTSASSVTIDATGLHFQAMGQRHLAFAAIERVELQRKWNGPALLVIGREWGNRLTITLAHEADVRSILRALPDTVPLSPKASELRDLEPAS